MPADHEHLTLDVVLDGFSAKPAWRGPADSGDGTTFTVATRHSAGRLLADCVGDIVVLADLPPSARQRAAIERAFATDPELVAWYEHDPAVDSPGRPAWSIERLRTHDYLGSIVALRGDLARRLGGLDAGCFPFHRWDLLLRAAELSPGGRVEAARSDRQPGSTTSSARSTSTTPEGRRRGIRVLQSHLTRSGVRGLAEPDPGHPPGRFRVRRLPPERPLASIIIASPASGHPDASAHLDALTEVLAAVTCSTDAQRREIIVVTDDTIPAAELRRLRELAEGTADVLPVCRNLGPHWRHLDIGVSLGLGEVFVLVDDTAIVARDGSGAWLDELVAIALDPAVGAAGAVDRADSAATHGETDRLPPGAIAMRREVISAIGIASGDPEGRALPSMLAQLGLSAVAVPSVRFERQRATPLIPAS